MRIMKLLGLVVVILAFSGIGLRADNFYVGGSYTNIPFNSTSYGGGSIDVSSLDGVTLPWVYCLQIGTTINVPGSYNATLVTHNGTIDGGAALPNGSYTAAKIAYLLEHFAQGGQGDAQGALQAAIWYVEGFGSLGAGADGTMTTDYNNDLTALAGTTGGDGDPSAISKFDWLTPMIPGSGTQYQALVTTAVPDGGMTLMLLGGALVGLATLRRMFRA